MKTFNQNLKVYGINATLLIALFFGVIVSSSRVDAQEKRNAFYIEAGGNAGLYSINYDRLMPVSEKTKFAPRVGLSYLGHDFFIIPIEANFLFGKSAEAKNFKELGLGLTHVTTSYFGGIDFNFGNNDDGNDDSDAFTLYSLRAGFRHQKPDGGFMYRLAGMLFYNPNTDKLRPFFGISVGHAF